MVAGENLMKLIAAVHHSGKVRPKEFCFRASLSQTAAWTRLSGVEDLELDGIRTLAWEANIFPQRRTSEDDDTFNRIVLAQGNALNLLLERCKDTLEILCIATDDGLTTFWPPNGHTVHPPSPPQTRDWPSTASHCARPMDHLAGKT